MSVLVKMDNILVFLNDQWIVFKSFEARLILVDRKNMKAIGELSPPNYDNKSGEYIVSFEVLDGNRLLVQHGNSTLTICSFPSQELSM